MTDVTLFVGLDVHKKTISVAMVEGSAGAVVRFYGTVTNTPDSLRTLCRKLSQSEQQLHFCYEAGPCGYGVQRQLTRLGHHCDVVAPALIPRKVGDKVKTDRRDAMMLAQTLRAGQLTAVWVPDEAHEAMRDLVRLRAQAMRDLRKTRQQLLSFLLRHGLVSPYGHWTKMHRRWLGELVFAHPAQHLAHEEMLQRIERAEALCDRLKAAIIELVPQWSLAPVVEAIQALRGVSLIVASVIVAEVGCFARFDNPRQLMAFLGLNHRSIEWVRRSGEELRYTRRLGFLRKRSNRRERIYVFGAWTVPSPKWTGRKSYASASISSTTRSSLRPYAPYAGFYRRQITDREG